MKKVKKFFMPVFTLICALMTYFITGILFFPSEIKLMAGDIHRFNFGLPISATIEPESVSVSNLNGEPVENNIRISSENNSLTLMPSESGTATMNLNAFGFPVKNIILDVLPETEVVPWGATVGVKINTDGVLVLGTGYVIDEKGVSHNPCEGILKSGDLILEINGEELGNKERMIELVETSSSDIKLKVKRGTEILEPSINPIKSMEDKQNKIGVWVRDSTQGIGTVTYYNPDGDTFAALGHGIIDIDTKQLMVIKGGDIMPSEIVSVKKGKKGTPGELVGNIQKNQVIGTVKKNTPFGIYGIIKSINKAPTNKVKIALQDKVHEGPAVIRSNVEKDEIKEYDVYIESVNRYSSDDSKGMVIKITDPRLLEHTSGIVQGMSGSPILQNHMLIGAVTHVFVQDPTKGYGIFIENMLKQENLL